MPSIMPTFEMPALAEDTTTNGDIGPKYGKSWFFDFKTGDFVLDGQGRVVELDGHRAWAQWCVKTVLTERFSRIVYGFDYGVELDTARKASTREATEAEVARTVTEALTMDPRTESVSGFTFSWEPDPRTGDVGLRVGFTAVPVVGTPERLEVRLNG
jgi:hypothetical protein